MPPNSNSAPVAVHDHVEMPVDGVVEIPVLSNDRDTDDDALAIVSFTLPAHGTLASVANDTFRYTPAPGYVGDDAFTYTIRDPAKGSSTASVTISVQAPNAAPSAVADAVTTVRDVPVTFDVRANDEDPDGDPLRITDHTSPAHGDLVLNADQSFTYAPARGFTGADAFTYRVADGRGGSAEARVELTVVEPNAPPVATSDHATTVQDTAIRLDLLANDADPDADPLTIVGVSVPTHGLLAVHGDQTVTYTPHPDFLGADSFTYTVADGRGRTSSVVAAIEVIPPNRPPTALALDATTVAENAAGAVVGNLTVTDPDADDAHRFAVDDDRFEVVDRALKLKADTALDAEAEPEVALTITATDTGGLAYDATFTLTVEAAREPPTAVDDAATTVANTAVDVDVLANDEDPASRPLSLVAVAEPTNGTAAIVDERAVYEPAYGFVGRDRFAYTIANDLGLEDEAVVTVDVAGDGEPFADGTFFADGTGWLDSAA